MSTTATPATVRERTIDRVIAGRSSETATSRGLIGLPDRIVYILCAVFAVAGTLAAFRIMYWWLFLPLIALVLIFTWRFVPQSAGTSIRHLRGAVIAVVLAIVWFALQIPLASQYLVPIRDPGIYAIVGAGIAHTGGSPIDITSAVQLAKSVPGLASDLGPFPAYGTNEIRLQGSNGVPSILAIGFWLGGVQGEILVPLVVGAVGLLALYGLSRRFMGPYWALLPSLILGLAMPYLYFSRTTYTEMMTLVLLVAAGSWLVSAFNTGRKSDFIIAGALVGASGLTRIDGALEFIGVLAGLALVLLGLGRTEADTGLRKKFLLFTAAGSVMLGIGIFDLLYNNPRYVHDLGSDPRNLWAVTGLAVVAVVVLCLTPLGRRSFQWGTITKRIALVVSIALAVLFVFWLSRPWWFIDHNHTPGPYANAVAGLQAQDGLPIDPTRRYSEYSLWWYGWYFGWIFLALSIVGMCFWVGWAIARRNAAHVVMLVLAAVVSLLYLDQIKITPDQIWAFRRVLPVITPTLVLASVFAIRWLWKSPRRWLRWVAIIAIVGSFIGVFIPWGKIIFTVEEGGQAAEIEQICSSVGDAKMVVLVGQDAPANYAPTIREICNVQVVTITDVSTFDWKTLGAAAKEPTAVVTFDSDVVDWVKTPTHADHTAVVTEWTRHLLQTPRTAIITVRSVWVGKLESDGKVSFTAP